MVHGIYLDNSMATRPSDKAVARMLPFFTQNWGSPSSPHLMGQELFPSIEESLKSIYALLGASEQDDFVFTSSNAEAVNQVFLSSFMDVTRSTGKNQFITSHIEEAPAIMSLRRLQDQMNCVGKFVNPDHQGKITAEIIAEAITPRTALISLSWANGLTGVVNPIADIAKVCDERGILLHVEASHILGKLFYELDEIKPAFITFEGSLLHAPAGSGGLYIRAGHHFSSFIVGGLEQAGKRAGSFSVASLAALGQAAVEALESRDFLCTEISRLRNKLEEGILNAFPDATIFFRDQERLPHCTTIGFPGIVNEALLFGLNRRNVFASIGGGSFQQIGLILKASGISDELSQTAINFSLSRYTTEDEIDRAIEIIGEVAQRLSKNSKHLDK
jgi:cysteine desulfurase